MSIRASLGSIGRHADVLQVSHKKSEASDNQDAKVELLHKCSLIGRLQVAVIIPDVRTELCKEVG